MASPALRLAPHRNPTVSAVVSSVCATNIDNSGVYVYYLKGIVSVCFRCPARTVDFSGTHLYLCVSTTNQAKRHSSAAHLLVMVGEREDHSPVVTCTRIGGPPVISTAGIYYKLRRLLA